MAPPHSVNALVQAACAGNQEAWEELVQRYAALVFSVCRQYRLSDADLHDVSQTVWLRMLEHLPDLREPRALPGWLATTARRECCRVRQVSYRNVLVEEPWEASEEGPDVAGELLAAERRSALREAFAALPPAWRELMLLLIADPPLRYEDISRRLGIPQGSIGPTRARCISRMRENASLAALLKDEQDIDGSGAHTHRTEIGGHRHERRAARG